MAENANPSSSGGPVLAIALGAVVLVFAVVLVMTVNSEPADAQTSTDTAPTADTAAAPPAPSAAPGADAGKHKPGTVVIGAGSGEELVELELDLPNEVTVGTPKVIPKGVNIDKKRFGKSRAGVLAPKGLLNVAADKPVTSSDEFPVIGDLPLVTDGDKEALDGRFVELAPGRQWVQIDLGKAYDIWAIMVWHNHLDPRVYRDVIVQVSNDPQMKEGVTIVFNNDHDNSAGMGSGEHYEYFENYEGELMPVEGVTARYVRLWSNGSTQDDANHYAEVDVLAREPKEAARAEDPPAGSLGLCEQESKDAPAEAKEAPAAKKHKPGVVVIGEASGEELAELELDLPNPVFAGTPKVIPDNVRIDKKRLGKSRAGVMAPKGLTNVAEGKDVTSSDDFPIIGDLTLVTDGDKEALDGRFVELAPGKQWVQIDLGKPYEVWALMVWHNHIDPRVYRDVIAQVSNDESFKEGVTTVFNNDNDNSSGLGRGEDYEYFENFEGELMPATGVVGRYVRLWSKGSTLDDANHYAEVEVFAREPKPSTASAE